MIKVPVYVYASHSDITDDFSYWAYFSARGEHIGILVAETEIEVADASREDLVNGTVKILRARQSEIRAKMQSEVESIEHRIGKLLSIEDKS